MDTAWANNSIPMPHKGVQLQKEKYRLSDIADLCHRAVKEDMAYMSAFAAAFPPTIEGLRSLFGFCNDNLHYLEDPSYDKGAVQAVQSPQWLWHRTKTGDCKSYTNFIACTVLNMGLPVVLRLVDYGNLREKHIYPCAVINGKLVPMDVVYAQQQGGRFGQEKTFSHKIKDIRMNPISNYVKQPGLYKVGATDNTITPQQLWNGVMQLEEMVASDLPNDIVNSGAGDVTLMTQGQLDRMLAADRFRVFAKTEQDAKLARAYTLAANAVEGKSVAGLYGAGETELARRLNAFLAKTEKDNKPAFENFSIAVPKFQDPDQDIVIEGIGKIKIGKFVKKVVDKVGDLFKQVVNWIFKGAGKKMGPYFLFLAAGPAAAVMLHKNAKVKKRMAEQKKAFAWIAKKGKFSEKQLMSLAQTGIKEELGGTPDQLIAHYASAKVGAIPAAVVALPKIIGAMGMVVEVMKKITGLFKKKEATPEIKEEFASDPTLLEGLDAPGSAPSTTTPTGGNKTRQPGTDYGDPSEASGGGGTGLAIAAAVAALLFMGS